MTTLPLPEKSVPLSSAGFGKIYESVRANPAAARSIADEIEANPRRVLEHAFKITKQQKKAIDGATDTELRERARALLAELRSETPGTLEFHPDAARIDHGGITPARVGPPPPPHMSGCSCSILVPIPNPPSPRP